ncbi:uncharacterized protein LTR77_006841 [Saxophila tyrrhenica]|uniref:Methyltransferase domain-containing protein n=1 Tax=Saxophila tyrrhenica TaxID=1690608 RepID=A0AAV9P630_9PEZI|nr:hypothetical protein LTR77_006841 [Saxophila tyrrhenica]
MTKLVSSHALVQAKRHPFLQILQGSGRLRTMASTPPQALSTVPAASRVVATNEKVTGPAGAEMLRRSGITSSDGSSALQILDNACGGGILTSLILDEATKRPDDIKIKRILAIDNDESILAYVRKRSRDSDWKDVEIQHMDQTSLSLSDNSFDNIFSNFGIFFHPNDAATLSETYRTLVPGGVAGLTSWKSISWWPSVALPAFKTYLPDAPALPPNVTIFPAKGWTDTASIPEKLEKAGFKDVQVSEYSFTPTVEAEEFAEATAVLAKVVMRRLWRSEDFSKFEGKVQEVLLRYLRENYAGGKWDGEMVAIITIGRK